MIEPRHPHQTPETPAGFAAALADLRADLGAAEAWLTTNADALGAAGAVTPRFGMGSYGCVELKLSFQCPTREAWAAVARVLMAGAGVGECRKSFGESVCVYRSFGRVRVEAWIPRERVCRELTGVAQGWDCSDARVLAGVSS